MSPDGGELGRALDLHHEAVVCGIIDVCAVCGISTDDGMERGHRHAPLEDERDRASSYLVVFGASVEQTPQGAA